MAKNLALNKKKSIILEPKAPYNFDANFYKPSHFPSSDNVWEKEKYWITMIWKSKRLGLKFENTGTVNKPKIKVNVYSQKELSYYFWDRAIKVPKKLEHIIINRQGCKCVSNEDIDTLKRHLSTKYNYGKIGKPNKPEDNKKCGKC